MKKILLFFILSGFLYSCSTDFETNAPWKETMVVYGLLNPNDTIQYIRISKAFLGEGNALIMAREGDSIYYGDVLDVKLDRYLNNSLIPGDSQMLIRLDSVPKNEGGVFAAPYQEVYAYTKTLPSTNDGSVYKLTIINRSTGNVVRSSTKLIENFPINSPNTFSLYKFNTAGGQTWKIISSELGKVYGITQKINYTETTIATGDSVKKSIEWYLGDKLSISESEGEIRFPLVSRDMYRLLGDNIAVDPGKSRSLDPNPIDVYITGGTEEIYTYMQVSNENTGIVQDKPLYTNIENGIGLFSSRNIRKVSIHLHPESYAALDTSEYTRDLNFTN